MAAVNSVSSNLYRVNFRAKDNDTRPYVVYSQPKSDRQSQIIYQQQKSMENQKKKQNFSWGLGVLLSAVMIAAFLPQVVRNIKEAAAKKAAEAAAKKAIENTMKAGAEKAEGKINLEGCKYIGEFVKFENIIDDASIGDLATTKTLEDRIRNLGINMIEDLKIPEKYVLKPV